jgi:hypothetical protein
VSINAAIPEGVNHPARPELIHPKTITTVPEEPLNASSTSGLSSSEEDATFGRGK